MIAYDRGVQYRNIDDKYIRIADRFHPIANLSDLMIERLKNILSKIIKIKDDKMSFIKSTDTIEDSKTNEVSKPTLTLQQKRQLDIILEIKKHFNKGISIH